jgi:hypothetical protein
MSDLQTRIQRFTEDLFSSSVAIVDERDPETDAQYFAVCVETQHETADVVRLNDAWHRWMLSTARQVAGDYRLALCIR